LRAFNPLTALTTHNAPPVLYPLGRSRFLGVLLSCTWLAGLVLVLLWYFITGKLDWRLIISFAAVLGTGVAAYIGWSNAGEGQLAWDGEFWRWESSSYQTGIAEYELSVIADFQHMLLLRLDNQAHARLWLWAERSAMPERWLDLRRAVHSPRKSSATLRQHHLPQAEPVPTVAVLGHAPPVNAPRIKS